MGGSNWRLKRVETIKLEVAQYRPIYGGGRKKFEEVKKEFLSLKWKVRAFYTLL
jgi:hypothetical protein